MKILAYIYLFDILLKITSPQAHCEGMKDNRIAIAIKLTGMCAADSRFLPSALSHLPVALRVLEFLHLFVWHSPERIYDEEHDEQGDYHR